MEPPHPRTALPMTRLPLVTLSLLAAAAPALAQNDTTSPETPLAVWRFDAAEPGVPKEATKFREPGPRPPTYPSFPATNTALTFGTGNGGVTVREADLPNVNLRFGTGDSITIEAWVKVSELKDGNYA